MIDEEKKITHSSLMDETEKGIVDPSKAGVKLKTENAPIFQSGGEFDLSGLVLLAPMSYFTMILQV